MVLRLIVLAAPTGGNYQSLQIGTSTKMLSIVPLVAASRPFVARAGGSSTQAYGPVPVSSLF